MSIFEFMRDYGFMILALAGLLVLTVVLLRRDRRAQAIEEEQEERAAEIAAAQVYIEILDGKLKTSYNKKSDVVVALAEALGQFVGKHLEGDMRTEVLWLAEKVAKEAAAASGAAKDND